MTPETLTGDTRQWMARVCSISGSTITLTGTLKKSLLLEKNPSKNLLHHHRDTKILLCSFLKKKKKKSSEKDGVLTQARVEAKLLRDVHGAQQKATIQKKYVKISKIIELFMESRVLAFFEKKNRFLTFAFFFFCCCCLVVMSHIFFF